MFTTQWLSMPLVLNFQAGANIRAEAIRHAAG